MQVGIVPIEKALDLANEAGLDLVEVAPDANPPVCRIMDFGKYKYKLEVSEKERKKKQSQTSLKEIKIRPKINKNDFLVKESTCLIYPNPSYGFSSLQIGEGFLNLETCVTIFDMNGTLISRKFMIPDRRNLLTPLIIPESGIYLVTVKSGSKEQVLKWIVMKQ